MERQCASKCCAISYRVLCKVGSQQVAQRGGQASARGHCQRGKTPHQQPRRDMEHQCASRRCANSYMVTFKLGSQQVASRGGQAVARWHTRTPLVWANASTNNNLTGLCAVSPTEAEATCDSGVRHGMQSAGYVPETERGFTDKDDCLKGAKTCARLQSSFAAVQYNAP
jgi:hypothetical protein